MTKPIRIIVRVLGLLLILAVGAAAAGWYLSRMAPEGYRAEAFDAARLAELSNRTDQKLIDAQAWAARSHAAKVAREGEKPDVDTVKTLSFTQDELNATLQKWSTWNDYQQSYEAYVKSPMLLLGDGRITLAGKIPEVESVVGVQFEPVMSKGMIHLKIARVSGGRLPLPRTIIDKPLKKLADAIRAELPRVAEEARLDSTGGANADATRAGLLRLILALAEDRPTDAVLFLPVDEERFLPVQLTGVTISEKSIDLQIQPLDDAERQAFLSKVRAKPEVPAVAAQD